MIYLKIVTNLLFYSLYLSWVVQSGYQPVFDCTHRYNFFYIMGPLSYVIVNQKM